MNTQAKRADTECRGPLTKSGIRQPSISAFMDDLAVTTTAVPGARWILQGVGEDHGMGTHEFQANKVQVIGSKKGRLGEHLIPLKPWEGLQLQSE